MRVPKGYPIRSVTEKKYYDDLGSCLGVQALEPDGQHTLRVITNRSCQDNYALDYPVNIDEVEAQERGGEYPYLDFSVVFRPVTAEGIVLPNSRRERIMKSGLLYSCMRIVFTSDFESGHSGYFVGSDDIDDEWLNFQLLEPSDRPVDPELITV